MGDGFVMFFFQWVHLCGFEVVFRTGYVTNFLEKSLLTLLQPEFPPSYLDAESEFTVQGLAGVGYLASNAMYTVDAGHMSLKVGPESFRNELGWTWIGTGWFYLQQMNTNYMIYIKCYIIYILYIHILYIVYTYYILYIHILKVKVCTYYAECFHI